MPPRFRAPHVLLSSPRRLVAAPLYLLAALFFPAFGFAQSGGLPGLVPWPRHLEPLTGTFSSGPTVVVEADSAALSLGHWLGAELAATAGLESAVFASGAAPFDAKPIRLRLREEKTDLGVEGYILEVFADSVVASAPTATGLLYACQTLRQLITTDGEAGQAGSDIRIPAVSIRDTPRFSWRGLMLDCSRTFQSIDYLKKTIDRMSFYKLNVLHLHLTDDQGWRLEIERYPELTEQGARFPDRYDQPESVQGSYTRQEMRALIAYAAERGVTIVPEIEMPGHSLAALSVFPGFSCTGGPFEIYPFFQGPGITKDIYCPSESTFAFLEDVLDEVITLFPGAFLHIGGDEAPKDRWKESPLAQAILAREGLATEEELQSYFIRRIEGFINSRGKRLIGWDEILEGGLAPNAAVMSWRGIEGGIEAARAGHDVVMSPTSHCYFDYTYETTDTRKAYSFEPVPTELSPEEATHVLGLQANFWSHIDRTPDRVDYQLFPRLLAIAERGWSDASARDWEEFRTRLDAHRIWLERFGIAYRNASFER